MKRIFRVSSRFYSSPAVVAAGNSAIGLWTLAGSWTVAQDEDTVPPVPESVLQRWTRDVAPIAGKLVKVGLWEAAPVPADDEPAWSFVQDATLFEFKVPQASRPEIPEGLRTRVYRRDGYACLHCGATKGLSLDHIYPYSLGGPDTFDNLQTLCSRCNSSKGARV